MKRSIKALRKILVALIGFPLLGIGIVLIPLPGPGVLVSLLAFFILSLEFEWADKYFQRAKQVIVGIYKKAKEQADKTAEKLDKQ